MQGFYLFLVLVLWTWLTLVCTRAFNSIDIKSFFRFLSYRQKSDNNPCNLEFVMTFLVKLHYNNNAYSIHPFGCIAISLNLLRPKMSLHGIYFVVQMCIILCKRVQTDFKPIPRASTISTAFTHDVVSSHGPPVSTTTTSLSELSSAHSSSLRLTWRVKFFNHQPECVSIRSSRERKNGNQTQMRFVKLRHKSILKKISTHCRACASLWACHNIVADSNEKRFN